MDENESPRAPRAGKTLFNVSLVLAAAGAVCYGIAFAKIRLLVYEPIIRKAYIQTIDVLLFAHMGLFILAGILGIAAGVKEVKAAPERRAAAILAAATVHLHRDSGPRRPPIARHH